jgi:hypothetical protein
VSHVHDEFQSEPIPGLPENLPPGEKILWQGSPLWWDLAKQVFHIRAVAVYFAVLILWRAGVRLDATGSVAAAFVTVLSLVPLALVGLGLFALLAYLSSRTTIYTITNRRVVLRIGIALPTSFNIPFAVVAAAGLCVRAGGSGDIPLQLSCKSRIGYANLWPHARPWHLRSPEPMLRAIPDAGQVADLLGSALREALPAGAKQAKAMLAQPGSAPRPAAVGAPF